MRPWATRGRGSGGRRAGLGALAAMLTAAQIATALHGRTAAAAPSAADGRQIFDAHCAVCHATEPEFHKEGPSLAGVFGRRAGTAPFFPQYRGLKGSQVVWTDQTLDAWLSDPRAFIGGRDTSMNFRLADADERAAVIAYLRTLR